MRLTSRIRHIGIDDIIVEHGATDILRNDERHLDRESTVIGSLRLSIAQLLVMLVVIPAESHLATNGIADLSPLNGNTGIGRRLGLNANGIALLVRLFILLKLNLERRTLILLNTNTDARVLCTNGKAPIQLSGRQGEVGSTLTKAVGNNGLLSNDLIVGVAQLQLHLLMFDSLMFQGRMLLPHDSRHVDGLSWTVDAAIGKQTGMLCVILMVVVSEATVVVDGRTEPIIWGKGIDARLTRHLLQRGISKRLTTSSIDNDIAHGVRRHGLHHDAHSRYEVEHTRRLRLRGCSKLQHIDAGRQTGHLQRIVEELVFTMSAKATRLGHLLQLRQSFLDLLIVLRIVGIQFRIALQCGTIDAHRQALQVAQTFQRDGLRFMQLNHLGIRPYLISGIGERAP